VDHPSRHIVDGGTAIDLIAGCTSYSRRRLQLAVQFTYKGLCALSSAWYDERAAHCRRLARRLSLASAGFGGDAPNTNGASGLGGDVPNLNGVVDCDGHAAPVGAIGQLPADPAKVNRSCSIRFCGIPSEFPLEYM
jgi:hypothetical protein